VNLKKITIVYDQELEDRLSAGTNIMNEDQLIQKIIKKAQHMKVREMLLLFDVLRKRTDDEILFLDTLMSIFLNLTDISKEPIGYYLCDVCTELAKNNQLENVTGYYEILLKHIPKNHPNLIHLVMIHYANALQMVERNDEAHRIFNLILEFEPDNEAALISSTISLLETGRYKEALEYLKSLSPDNPEGIYLAAQTYMSSNEFDIAIDLFKKFLEIKPDYFAALNNLGRCLGVKDQFEEAMPYFSRIVKVKTDYAIGWLNYGTSLIFVGDPVGAIAKYKVLVLIDPQFQFIYFVYLLLGVLSYKYGDPKEGDRFFTNTLKFFKKKETEKILQIKKQFKNNLETAPSKLKSTIEKIPKLMHAYATISFDQPLEKFINKI